MRIYIILKELNNLCMCVSMFHVPLCVLYVCLYMCEACVYVRARVCVCVSESEDSKKI